MKKKYCTCGCLDLTENYMETKKLPIEEFHSLAKSQIEKFPDLLQFDTEEGIIDCFYEFYKRKRVKNEEK